MFPDQVIYTANADVGLLGALFNGVAMICDQNELIWSFAMMAALWRLFSMTASASLRSTNGPNAGTGVAQNSVGLITPFLLAMSLTAADLRPKVTIESGLTGTVTEVANVPFIISVVPATASLLSTEVGAVVRSAYSGTTTDYDAIAATGNGFINPLKVLLTSRTAIMRMSGITSEVNAVISSCLGSDAGVDYATISRLVSQAGNTGTVGSGATSSESIQVTGAGAGTVDAAAPATGIGALLFQASQVSGYVTGVGSPDDLLSCKDGAELVAQNINDALSSPEFERVIQGAVNSTDEANSTTDHTFASFSRRYQAIRTARVVGALAGGADQANAEAVNLLFSQLVNMNLNCLKTNASTRVACHAGIIQANEIERNNIQAAANSGETLMYAGQFANYITALIIGLGPILIMFMMFSGMEAAKNMQSAVHMLVWPLLIMNVGAEIVNGMIYQTISNFLSVLTKAQMLSPALAVEAYKMFSLKVGTASHIMSALPILMSTIFALGQSAALVKISDKMSSNTTRVGESASPPASNAVPLLNNSSVATAKQTGSGAVASITGHMPAGNSTYSLGALRASASNDMQRTKSRQHALSQIETEIGSWQKAYETGNFSQWGLTTEEGRSIVRNAGLSTQVRSEKSAEVGSSTDKSTNSAAQVGLSGHGGLRGGVSNAAVPGTPEASEGGGAAGGASGGKGKVRGKGGIDLGIGGKAGVTSGATDTVTDRSGSRVNDAISKSASLQRELSNFNRKSESGGESKQKSQKWTESLAKQKQWSAVLSETDQSSESARADRSRAEEFVTASGKLSPENHMLQYATNREYQRFVASEGRALAAAAPGIQRYLDKVDAGMESGSIERPVGDNPMQAEGLRRLKAASQMASDHNATEEERMAATAYLINAAEKMEGVGIRAHQTIHDVEAWNQADVRNGSGVPGNMTKEVSSMVRKGIPKGPAWSDTEGRPMENAAKQMAPEPVIVGAVRDRVEGQTSTDRAGREGRGDDGVFSRAAGEAAENVAETTAAVVDSVKEAVQKAGDIFKK